MFKLFQLSAWEHERNIYTRNHWAELKKAESVRKEMLNVFLWEVEVRDYRVWKWGLFCNSKSGTRVMKHLEIWEKRWEWKNHWNKIPLQEEQWRWNYHRYDSLEMRYSLLRWEWLIWDANNSFEMRMTHLWCEWFIWDENDSLEMHTL